MLNEGDQIKIRYSRKLAQIGNGNLVNRKAIVKRVVHTGNSISGAIVDVKMSRTLKSKLVPIESIEGAEAVDKMRTLGLLKTSIV